MSDYPIAHMFIRSEELRRPTNLGLRINYLKNYSKIAKKKQKYLINKAVKELMDHGLINMKSVNKALAAKTNTSRKEFINKMFPSANDYKMQTWAFAYIGNGYFLIDIAEQHPDDNFSRKEGREIALYRLNGQINFFNSLKNIDPIRSISKAIHISDDLSAIPEKVLFEMKRMISRNDPEYLEMIRVVNDSNAIIPENQKSDLLGNIFDAIDFNENYISISRTVG